jgi:hypothetical protein
MRRLPVWNSRLIFASLLVAAFLTTRSSAAPVADPGSFVGTMHIIDYRNSPVGVLPGSTSITNQYSAWGVLHDGSTTTPPGPPGISSLSGLPGLESYVGDLDQSLPITITFSKPFRQVGAYFLMGSANDSITLTALRADSSVIESTTIAPAAMPLRPGPFGFNEGFVGLIVNEPIASIRFSPRTLPFVIDDLHFNVPEPAPIILVGVALCAPFIYLRACGKR